jgi:hypothetical protein
MQGGLRQRRGPARRSRWQSTPDLVKKSRYSGSTVRAVLVETGQNLRLVVPLSWTDLKPRLLPAQHSGRPVYLLSEALLELAAWVQARASGKGSEEVGYRDEEDETSGRETGGRDGEQGRATASGTGEPWESSRLCSRRHDPAFAVVEQAGSPSAAGRSHGTGPKEGGEP